MGDLSQLLVTFLNPIILIMALVLALSIVSRRRNDTINIDVLMGGLLSLAVIQTMSDPVTLPNGGQFDMRGLLVGLGAAIFGPRTGILVAITALSYRFVIAGPGLIPGLTYIVVAYCVGVVWFFAARNVRWPDLVQSVVLGVLLCLPLVAILLGPRGTWGPIFMMVGPYTLVCNVLGTVLIRYLIRNEMRFLDSTAGLREAALTDHLTGLLNRRSLETRLSVLTEDRSAWRYLTALYFDIDKFKGINDTYGHAAGDAVLQVVSSRLAATFRPEDMFSRLGGDEFVVILPNLAEHEARSVAERCRRLVADDPIIVGSHEISATISIGAVWMDQETKPDRLLQLADKALYSAKASGRNIVAFEGDRQRSSSQQEPAVA